MQIRPNCSLQSAHLVQIARDGRSIRFETELADEALTRSALGCSVLARKTINAFDPDVCEHIWVREYLQRRQESVSGCCQELRLLLGLFRRGAR